MSNWTSEQQTAIYERNCNLLVSAAAGSGKTAVLVERIVSRVFDEQNPVDIDRIVIVTFTKSAAGEMKERLTKRFEDILKADCGNRRAIRQIALINHAKITTIDSFCSYILKNYYNTIGYEPSYRIADKGETELIKEDVYNELLEERLKNNDENLITAINSLTQGKSIAPFFDIIKKLYDASESHPWPKEWLSDCAKLYDIDNEDELNASPVIEYLFSYIKELLNEMSQSYDNLIELCEDPGLSGVRDVLCDDKSKVTRLLECNSFTELNNNADKNFRTKPRAGKGTDKELSDYITAERNSLKKEITEIIDLYCCYPYEDIIDEVACVRTSITAVVDFTIEFADRYREAKEERQIAEFSDVAHRALEILVSKEGKTEKYTHVADELSELYDEIYIDEYQDSNYVQEKILNAVSRCRFGCNNIFMVGDVKQSIYRFRMARPEIFIDKYNTYTEEQSPERKIELHKNFRSTVNVINSVNDIFRRIMKKSVGNIEYNDDAALNYGGNIKDEINTDTDICMYVKESDDYNDDSKGIINAEIAAMRIKEIMAENEKLTYKDFVILLRSGKDAGPEYVDTLGNMGIPADYASTTGYFSAYEVRLIIDVLKVIDNERQEIPLLAVMKSYFAGFTANEMALIKGNRRKKNYYDCLCEFSKGDGETAKKCRKFINFIGEYRKKAGVMTIRELVSELIYSTGYYDYVGFLLNGSRRKMNINMFILQAEKFEKTSFSGLFNFVRYIDKIRNYDVDFGESGNAGNDNNYVRIMTIHQSKGLQFPVVILGNSDKRFNEEDLKSKIIIDEDFGISMDYVDLKSRRKQKFLFKEIMKKKCEREGTGEEIRLLYVALTRAVQKLVVTGVVSSKKYEEFTSGIDRRIIDMKFILGNKNYSSLILGALQSDELCGKYNYICYDNELLTDNVKDAVKEDLTDINELLRRAFSGRKDTEQVKNTVEYIYPHKEIKNLKSKYSVSEIKHMSMEENEDEASKVIAPERTKVVPRFRKGVDEEVKGTLRGTAYHRFFEILNYDCCKDYNSIEEYLKTSVAAGKISEEYAGLINLKRFEEFLQTDLGKRMGSAYKKGLLFREQPFIMELGADMIDKEYPSDEKILVQGIVDAFFFEDDKVYIVDYKTDRVEQGKAGEKALVERYHKQLELYADTISRVTGKETGGCYIYSTCLKKEILI